MRNIGRGFILFPLLCISLIVLVFVINFLIPPRVKYYKIDFTKDAWMASFVSDYENGVASGEDWVKHSETVALRVAGYPNDDNTRPAQVRVETMSDGRMIYTISSQLLMDDSIERQEYRVELILNGNVWIVDWAGMRQQCARGLGFGWTTAPCP